MTPIGEVIDMVLIDIWERIRAHRARTGEPMPTPHISEVVQKEINSSVR